MRFQTTETVPTTDTEKVLHALEVSLRELSDELERMGPRITMYGLGPSPRARNYRDTATFDVRTDSGSTTIRVDVSFQASALLGAAGQDVVVRSKLDYVFDQVRIQLGVPETDRPSSQDTTMHAAFGEPQETPEIEHDFHESPPADFYPAEEREDGVQSLPPAADENRSVDTEVASVAPTPSKAHPPSTSFSLWAASLRSVKIPSAASGSGAQPTVQAKEQGSETPKAKLAAEANKTNMPILLAVLLGVAVAAGSVYLYWAGLLSRMSLGRAHPKAAATAPQSQPAPPAQVPVQAPVEAFTAAPAPPRHEEPEPKVWLEQWAEAMRSRDAVLQASFYADPVARYLDDTNVSKEALTTFFRSQIQARNDLWTMRLDRVSIDPVTSTHVFAHLSKHFMEIDDTPDTSEKQISDRYVRSRLELRRVDGEWKIVSEQDVTPAGGTR